MVDDSYYRWLDRSFRRAALSGFDAASLLAHVMQRLTGAPSRSGKLADSFLHQAAMTKRRGNATMAKGPLAFLSAIAPDERERITKR